MAAQLQTFPYPTISVTFLSPNGFWAKSFSQTLPFKRVMDKHTDRQTKTQHFWFPCGVRILGMDLKHVLAPLKVLRLVHSFAARGH